VPWDKWTGMCRFVYRVFVLAWTASFLCIGQCVCAPVSSERAARVADTWVCVRFGASVIPAGGQPSAISDGDRDYAYVVDLSPAGYVVVAADDTIEPILVYSTQDTWSATTERVLGPVVRADVHARLTSTRRSSPLSIRTTQMRWQRLGGGNRVVAFGTRTLAAALPLDVHVPPLVTSRWNQGEYSAPYTYNSLTPDNLLTGCVATAMAAIVRFHRWPDWVAFSEYVDVRNERRLIDCDYAFHFDAMPDELTRASSAEEIAEVSKLMLACGAAVQTSYGADASYAATPRVAQALRERFAYLSAEWMAGDSDGWRESLKSELLAGYPVQMDMTTTDTFERHSLICDGWATEDGVDHFHLNFGWGGAADAWYAVPGYYVADAAWDVLEGYVYHIRRPGVWEGLAMVSCPVEVSDSDPKTVIGFAGDYWICYDTEYIGYPDAGTWFEAGQVPAGRGFWGYFASRTAGPTGRCLELTEEWPISLNPGWNIVGQPYVLPVEWDADRIMIEREGGDRTSLRNSGDCVAPYSWGWRSEPGTLAGGSYYLVGGSEFGDLASHRLVPWEAYWVRAYVSCRLVLPTPRQRVP